MVPLSCRTNLTGLWDAINKYYFFSKLFLLIPFLIKTSVADSDPGSGALLTPGYGMGIESGSITRIRIKDEPAGSYFRKHRNNFFGLKLVFWIWFSIRIWFHYSDLWIRLRIRQWIRTRILLSSSKKIAWSGSAFGSIGQRHGSAGPDPHRYVMDPEHWSKYCTSNLWCGSGIRDGKNSHVGSGMEKNLIWSKDSSLFVQ